ncbi:hypothetical protein FB45DRAFT_988472 [Roridomyces roridus]|uniref:Translocon-associated protein subunit alpha n=1 Tax=Roridomyces roridus TaxID=1738132 RepID=A0AAD7C3M6_9AGAR|nr:hypothetical protein FB45DRAFT_988472 [Roridomyces roridus]
MRLGLFLATALSFATLAFSAQGVYNWCWTPRRAHLPQRNSLLTQLLFPLPFLESNPFGHIVNGEKNTITLTVGNNSGKNVSLVSVGGAVYNVKSDALIKNASLLTAHTFSVGLIPDVKTQVPYVFYSEFQPGDIRLNVWLDYILEDTLQRASAYDSVVTVVEPELSIFDFKMISTYLVAIALLGGLVYVAYQSFAPKRTSRPRKKPAASAVSAPVGAVTATGAGGYQEEWIPDHHLRKSKSKKGGNVTSGDELSEMSGAELSSSEKKSKGKGRK